MKKLYLIILLLLFPLISILSQENKDKPEVKIELNMSVDDNEVNVDEAFIITVKFSVSGKNNTNNNDPVIEDIPSDDPDVAIKLIGTSSSIVISNGKVSKSNTYTFSIIIKKQGKFEIKPFIVKYKGKKYKTEKIKINAVKKIII